MHAGPSLNLPETNRWHACGHFGNSYSDNPPLVNDSSGSHPLPLLIACPSTCKGCCDDHYLNLGCSLASVFNAILIGYTVFVLPLHVTSSKTIENPDGGSLGVK